MRKRILTSRPFPLPPQRRGEHGGAYSLSKRKSKRPLNCRRPLHVTLRSDVARGSRSLLRHRGLVDKVLQKASRRFQVRIYQRAICGNHIHLLVWSRSRLNLQNFFRVIAGHIAQEILGKVPLRPEERKLRGNAPRGGGGGGGGYRRKFWDLLLYSRLLSWGREFRTVGKYVVQNTLEALGLVVYRPRTTRPRGAGGDSS